MPQLTIEQEPISILCYGLSGAGKSIFLGGSAKKKIAVIDVDKSLFSVAMYRNKNGYNQTFHQEKVNTYNEFVSAFNKVKKLVDAGEVDFVILDTVTELQNILINDILKKNGATKLDFQSAGPGWLDVRNIMITVASLFRTLNCDWAWSAQEKEKKIAGTESYKAVPYVQGDFANSIEAPFSVIVRAVKSLKREVVNGKPVNVTKRELWVAQSPYYSSKDRSMSLPPVYNTDDGIDKFLEIFRTGKISTEKDFTPTQIEEEKEKPE
jgi:hypothetical protein